MTPPIISVRNVGKEYRLGEFTRTTTLRDALSGWIARGPKAQKRRGERIWAVRDVSFDVAEGEVVGIIGANGAGKSTLLKILSRITEPTTGEIELRGRVASLLEVGTGFSDELTGRENIILNGAILGMSKREIDKKFDEIVEFSGVARFIDTPVKHYSSGMKMRLAFAVAAHLEPEILIVDEVLAVGDAEFQRKCLGKMGEVARLGRTILFVSHNLAAVEHLCTRCITLNKGAIICDGEPGAALSAYRGLSIRDEGHATVEFKTPRTHHPVRVTLETSNENGEPTTVFTAGSTMRCFSRFEIAEAAGAFNAMVALKFYDEAGALVMKCFSYLQHAEPLRISRQSTIECTISNIRLVPGRYAIEMSILVDREAALRAPNVGFIEIAEADTYRTGKVSRQDVGYIQAEATWTCWAADKTPDLLSSSHAS